MISIWNLMKSNKLSKITKKPNPTESFVQMSKYYEHTRNYIKNICTVGHDIKIARNLSKPRNRLKVIIFFYFVIEVCTAIVKFN